MVILPLFDALWSPTQSNDSHSFPNSGLNGETVFSPSSAPPCAVFKAALIHICVFTMGLMKTRTVNGVTCGDKPGENYHPQLNGKLIVFLYNPRLCGVL